MRAATVASRIFGCAKCDDHPAPRRERRWAAVRLRACLDASRAPWAGGVSGMCAARGCICQPSREKGSRPCGVSLPATAGRGSERHGHAGGGSASRVRALRAWGSGGPPTGRVSAEVAEDSAPVCELCWTVVRGVAVPRSGQTRAKRVWRAVCAVVFGRRRCAWRVRVKWCAKARSDRGSTWRGRVVAHNLLRENVVEQRGVHGERYCDAATRRPALLWRPNDCRCGRHIVLPDVQIHAQRRKRHRKSPHL